MGKLYVGDTGTVIRADVGQDVTGATGITIEVQKTSGAVSVSWPASVVAATPTKVEHVIASGELDLAGTYTCQVKLTLGTWTGRGDTFQIIVYDAYR